MFESIGNGQYADVARPLGCDNIEDSRGCAVADLNGDGLQDLIVANNADPPVIYMNRQKSTGNWLRIDLTDPTGPNPDAIGARVVATIADDKNRDGTRTLTRHLESGSGFASQHELTVHVGLGAASSILDLTVVWPDGTRQRLPANQLIDVINHRIRITRDAAEFTYVTPTANGITLTQASREAQADKDSL